MCRTLFKAFKVHEGIKLTKMPVLGLRCVWKLTLSNKHTKVRKYIVVTILAFAYDGGAADPPVWTSRRALSTSRAQRIRRGWLLVHSTLGDNVLVCHEISLTTTILNARSPRWKVKFVRTLRDDWLSASRN